MQPEVQPTTPACYSNNCSVMIGTSGYSYTEWIDAGFYPPGTKSSEMLPQYARQFQVVELNYTWYQMARADAVNRMVAKAPANFRFTAKLTRTLTHERDENWQQQLVLFKQGIAPLRSQLLAILVQLPPDFDRNTANRRYLGHLLEELEEYPIAVEFRHSSWATDSVFRELERRHISLVCVDEPKLPGLFPVIDVVTNPDLFYVRFHGRNAAGWRSSNMQKKFDYSYTQRELEQWNTDHLQKMTTSAAAGVIFFNNHVRAQAPHNARQLAQLLAD